MRLIIGGYAQGKRAYLLKFVREEQMADGESCPLEIPVTALAVDKLHLLARRWLENGTDPVKAALEIAERNPGMIFCCDEIGCGIVPMEREERDWREAVGRMCCALAARAQRVERVVCGIARVMKEEAST